MPHSNNLNTYADIKQVLDTLVQREGGRVPCGEARAAITWRHRAYKFRSLVKELDATTPYDGMVLSVDDKDPSIVVVRFRRAPDVTDLAGKPLDLQPPVDPLEEAAANFAEGLANE